MIRPLAAGKLVLLILAVLFLDSPTKAQQRVGFVLRINGAWVVDGSSQPLAPGEKLSAGARIKNSHSPPSDDELIVIADLHGVLLKNVQCKSGACYECRTSGTCYDPIQPLPSAGEGNRLSTIFEPVMDLFFGKPERYSVHRVRGPGANLEDGIAVLQDGQLALQDLAKNLETGTYRIRYRPISTMEAKQEGWSSRSIVWHWDPAEAQSVAAPEINAGLFEIALFQRGEAARAWVMIVNPKDNPELSLHFSEMREAVGKWGDAVSADVKQSYLRACLEYLSEIRAKRGTGNARQ